MKIVNRFIFLNYFLVLNILLINYRTEKSEQENLMLMFKCVQERRFNFVGPSKNSLDYSAFLNKNNKAVPN